MNAYVERVLAEVKARNASMPEFIQKVEEVLTSLEPVIAQHPKYEKNAILERMTTPDRMIEFRVTWCDDQGQPHVNRGWRVQFNGVIGHYKNVAKQNVGAAFVTKGVFTLTPEAKQPFELKATIILRRVLYLPQRGEMSKRFMVTVLKTVV